MKRSTISIAITTLFVLGSMACVCGTISSLVSDNTPDVEEESSEVEEEIATETEEMVEPTITPTSTPETTDDGFDESVFDQEVSAEVVQTTSYYNDVGLFFHMLVENTGESNTMPRLSVILYDESGEQIDEAFGSTYPTILYPGEKGIAYTYFDGETEFDSFEVVIDPQPDFMQNTTQDFEISAEFSLNDLGNYDIVGQVTNTGDQVVSTLQIAIALFNADDKLLTTDIVLPDDALNPGDTLDFDSLILSWDILEGETVDHIEIYVQGSIE